MKTFCAFLFLSFLLLSGESEARNDLKKYWEGVMKDQAMPEIIQALADHEENHLKSINGEKDGLDKDKWSTFAIFYLNDYKPKEKANAADGSSIISQQASVDAQQMEHFAKNFKETDKIAENTEARNDVKKYWERVMKDQPMPEIIQGLAAKDQDHEHMMMMKTKENGSAGSLDKDKWSSFAILYFHDYKPKEKATSDTSSLISEQASFDAQQMENFAKDLKETMVGEKMEAKNGIKKYWEGMMKDQEMPEIIKGLADEHMKARRSERSVHDDVGVDKDKWSTFAILYFTDYKPKDKATANSDVVNVVSDHTTK